jgi:hypothetical protein
VLARFVGERLVNRNFSLLLEIKDHDGAIIQPSSDKRGLFWVKVETKNSRVCIVDIFWMRGIL